MSNFFIPENKGTDSTGRFLDRNTNAGIYGAVIYAMILNQLGDESEALIKAAGLTPSSEDNTQWLQAIRKLYGDADTVLKGELVRKIDALKASNIAIDNISGITASNIQQAIAALNQKDIALQQKDTELLNKINALKATNIKIDAISGLSASNVQQAIAAIVSKLFPIGSQYIQVAESNGTFNANKSPEKLFGGTWKLLYAQEAIVLRTEGSKSNVGRINGVQPYGIKKMEGVLSLALGITGLGGNGVFKNTGVPYEAQILFRVMDPIHNTVTFDSSLQIKEYADDLVMTNRLFRIYERIA